MENPGVTIIAHRGASAIAPENTLAAVNLAWEHGADGVEIDIHLTRDNRIMVMHDDTTKRTAGVKHIIRDTTSTELRMLDVGRWKSDVYAGETMPFLEEVIGTVPAGKKLFVEIKCGEEIFPFLKNIIEQSGIKEQIILIGFGFHVMAACKKAMPDIPVCWLCSLENGKSGTQILKSHDYKKPLAEAVADTAAAGINCIDVRHTHVDRECIDSAHDHGLFVVAWTVNRQKDFRRLRDAGVDGITTDTPGEMIRLRETSSVE